MSIQNEKNVVLNENSVEVKPCINREIKSDEITIQLYSCYDINMDLPAVVTPSSIYRGCSTWKAFWEGKFTGKENLFLAVDMKTFGHRNVRRHKQIKGSDKYFALDLSSKFYSLDKIKITSSESKGKLERLGKGLINSLGFNTKARSKKYKKARYAIGNVSKKNLSKIIKDFEKIEKLPYEKKRPKHEPTDSSFHLARHLAKCMMRSDNLNRHKHSGYTEITSPCLNVNATEEDESKRIIVHKNLSENCYTDVSESKKNCQQNFIAEKFHGRIRL